MPAFETQVFQDIKPADYKPEKTVNPYEGKFISQLGQAAGGLITDLDKINAYESKKADSRLGQQVADAFEVDQASYNLYARSMTGMGPDIKNYIGEGKRSFLEQSLAAELGIEDLSNPVLQRASDTFTKIAYAREQGSTAEDVYRVRTMSTLKMLQNQSPQYADAIRKLAKKHLGYDPTNADVAQSIHALERMDAEAERERNKPKEMTDEERIRRALIQKNPALVLREASRSGNIDDGIVAAAQMEMYQQDLSTRSQLLDIKTKEQKITDDTFSTAAQAIVDQEVVGAISRIQESLANGGVVSPDQMITMVNGAINSGVAAAKAKAGNRISGDAASSITSYGANRSQFMADYINTGSFRKILESSNARLKAEALGMLLNHNEELLAAYSIGGENGGVQWLQAQMLASQSGGLMKMFEKTSPTIGGISELGRIIREGRGVEEMPNVMNRVRKGQGSEDDKKAAAVVLGQKLAADGGTTDANGKPVADPTLEEITKGVGIGNAISVFLNPQVALRISLNPHSANMVKNEAVAFANQLKQDINNAIPKDLRAAVKAEIVTAADGIKRIKYTIDRAAAPKIPFSEDTTDKNLQAAYQLANQRQSDAYSRLEAKLNDPAGVGPNAVGKSLSKYYELARLYGDNKYLPGIDSSDVMLQDIIDSTTQPSNKEQ